MRIRAFRLLTLLSVGTMLSLIVFWMTHLKDSKRPIDVLLKTLVNQQGLYEDVLDFLKNDNPQCHSLFSRSGWDVRMLHSAVFNDDYHRVNREFEEMIAKEKIEVNDNHSGQLIYLVLIYHLFAKQPWVTNVCEVGFGAGHGAIGWLSAKPTLKYYTFDIGAHDYTEKMSTFMKSRYADQFEIIIGDSALTVPKFVQSKSGTCDVVIIDGSPTASAIAADLVNMRLAASKANPLVMLANYGPTDAESAMMDSNRAWDDAIKAHVLTNVFSCTFLNVRDRGLAIGFYNVTG
jgi:predicted O-methyltransferase YrrM